jgi:hypothetical protein
MIKWLISLFAEEIFRVGVLNIKNWNSFFIVAIPLTIVGLVVKFGKK